MDNEIEKITQALINGDPLPIEDFVPKSRSEEYLKSALMNTKIEDLPNPQSRLDVLLCALNNNVHKEYSTKFEEGYSEGYDDGVEAGHTEDYEDGYANGYEAGTTEGNAEGYETGHADGYDSGREVGHDEGYEEGYISGHTAGHTEAYNSGYESGYNKGYDMGHTEDYDDGYTAGHEVGLEAGKQAEHDRFWDAYQKNGERTQYSFAFAGQGWDLSKDKPKYPLNNISYAERMFAGYLYTTLPNDIGLDTSKATVMAYMYSGSYLVTIPPTSIEAVRASYNLGYTFGANNCITIEKIIVSENTALVNTMFTNATKLENITFEGVIGKNGLSVSMCPKLTHDSLMSIINCLKDYSTDTSGTTWYVTLGSTLLAKLTEEEIAIATAKGWELR